MGWKLRLLAVLSALWAIGRLPYALDMSTGRFRDGRYFAAERLAAVYGGSVTIPLVIVWGGVWVYQGRKREKDSSPRASD
jgi:hypothetical protein